MNPPGSAALPPPFNLSRRFALTGGVVMALAMLAIGLWVTRSIEQNVIDNTAGATALFMDSFIAPLAQELDAEDTLSIGPIRAIEEMLAGSALGQRIVAVKIWKPDGRIAYSDEAELIGKRFPPSPSLSAALGGKVVAELDHLDDEENNADRERGMPLLEIYSPLREAFSGRILGALEFYENATALETTLDQTRLQTWAIVAAVTAAIGLALFGIVHRGSMLIAQQRQTLEHRIAEIRRVSDQNAELRRDIASASRKVAELNERTLRFVSAELHDGPAQLIGLAALRLDAAGNARAKAARAREFDTVRGALDEAMRDIRNLCNDLSLPEIEQLPVADVVRRAAAAHRSRTGTMVELEFSGADVVPPHAAGICAYRFVQETLNNAFRHAGGAAQHVACAVDRGRLTIMVSNGAGAPPAPAKSDRRSGLGLSGLKERVQSLGGRFEFRHMAEGGAEAEMTLTIEGGENHG